MKNFARLKSAKNSKLHSLEIRLILTYAVVILIATISIAVVILYYTGRTLQSKVGSLISTINAQMELNLNNYLDEIEETSTLVFIDEEYYNYDATSPALDEYDRVQMNERITRQLLRYRLMENFSDFGIVYRDASTVGYVSNGTKDLLGDRMFEEFEKVIDDDIKRDGWCIGISGHYDRLYYVNKINDNAILVTAIYTSELESTFERTSEMEDMTVRLMDAENTILFSSNIDETLGTKLSSEFSEMIDGESDSSIVNDDYLIAVGTSDIGWRILCTIPTSVILRENKNLQSMAGMAAAIIMVLTILLGVGLSRSVTEPVTDMVAVLGNKAAKDELTGTLNKKTFEENVRYALANSDSEYGFLLIDVDNFKNINDTAGHAIGDAVLAEIGAMLVKLYGAHHIVGRIGGDEFAIMIRANDFDSLECIDHIKRTATRLYRKGREIYGENMRSVDVKFSTGLSMTPVVGRDFDVLYKCADIALYKSKNSGKNHMSIYEEVDAHEK